MGIASFVGGWLSKKALDAGFREVVRWWRQPGQRSVLILGPGGVGKTTLGQFLSTPMQAVDERRGEYIETISIETFPLSDYKNVEIVVPPGQDHRLAASWAQIAGDIRSGKYRGIVVVAADGHHALGDISLKQHRRFVENPEADPQEIIAGILDDGRRVEEETVERVCREVHACDQPIWIMVVVLKQDLWWDDRDAVERRYASGRYQEIASLAKGRKSEGQFRYELAFASLVSSNLKTERRDVLKKTTAGYDDECRAESIVKLTQIFRGLMEWEKEHGD